MEFGWSTVSMFAFFPFTQNWGHRLPHWSLTWGVCNIAPLSWKCQINIYPRITEIKSTEAQCTNRGNSLSQFFHSNKIQDTYHTCYGMFTHVHRHKTNILKMWPKDRQNTEAFRKGENKKQRNHLARLQDQKLGRGKLLSFPYPWRWREGVASTDWHLLQLGCFTSMKL
jgi:hypothetical protein